MTVPVPGATRSTDPAAVGLDSYAAAVAAACPYLVPSMRGQQTGWTRFAISAQNSTLDHAESVLFSSGLWAAEQVRERVASGDRLAGEVVAVDYQVSEQEQAAALEWPYWALKNLLAPVGVIVGRFTSDIAPLGEPRSTAMVLALRATVPQRDRSLLSRTPELARTATSATDDGRNLLEQVPGLTAVADPIGSWLEVRFWARTLVTSEFEEKSCSTT